MIRILTAALCVFLLASTQAYGTSQTRTSAFEYDAGTGLLTKEIIEPDSSSLCLATTYSYDAYGNKVSATTRNCNGSSGEAAAPTGDPVFSSRTSSTSFAATTTNPVAGQFPGTSTNALSQSEAKEFDARFGGVTRLTGPNALATTWTYDGFGRKATETRADGTGTTWTYTICGTCPTGGKYFVTETSTGAPVRKVYFDALNREMRSEAEGFDGVYVRKDTEYDALGRVLRTSRPYKAAGSALWTVYAYDILGRVTQADEPAASGSGAGVRSVSAYAGLVSTVTVSNAGAGTNLPGGVVQTRTTTKNSQGQGVTVTDTQTNTVSYLYDPFGNLTSTNAGGVVTTLGYDLRGRKISMADPDMGSWTYAYNALGELIRQVDAKSQSTTMAYDKLGRMTTRTEPDLVSTWTYDACTKGVGKLCSVSADNGYARTHGYDSLGRPSSVSITVATAYAVTTTYDGAGRVDTLTYPTGFAVKHLYNSYGYLHKVQDTEATPMVYWQANSQNAAGQVTGETLGNGLTATRTYDALFRLTAASAASGAATPHSQSFTYDPIGNLTQRVDVTQSVTENLAYDTLNRLAAISGAGLTTRSFDYNAIGNLTYKSDAGGYTYPAIGSARTHAVASVSNAGAANSITASYTYDANGSLTAASGTLYPASGSVAFSRNLSYMSFNLPNVLSHVQGGSTYSYTYTYSAEHERVRLVTVRPSDTLTSIYIHPAGKGALLYEKETRASDGLIEHKHYVNGGAGLVGVYVTKSTYGSGEGPEMRYYHKDHLGSIAVITNPAGAVIERLAYEAYGERRYASGAPEDRSAPLIGVTTDRGFTTHEHLDEMMLIHMNGRIYDPVLARFMTPDPFVQAPGNLQSYNRYSYVNNNPLAYTDPTGYLSLDSFWDDVDNFLSDGGPAYIAAAFVVGYPVGMEYGWVSGGAAGGFTASFLASGGDLGAALRGAISGAAFGWAGGQGEFDSLTRYAAHAVAGCASGALMGGGCGNGAISAVAGKWITNGLAGPDTIPELQFVATVVGGGVASRIGGGKFANGAITAAFGYLFNELGDTARRAPGPIGVPIGDVRLLMEGARALGQWVVDVYDTIVYSSSYRERALISAGIDPASEAASNYDIHHVVQQGHLGAAPARANLAVTGIGVNDIENLVVLPRSQHQGIHTDAYRTAVNAVTTAAVPGGYGAMRGTLNAIKASLTVKGTFP